MMNRMLVIILMLTWTMAAPAYADTADAYEASYEMELLGRFRDALKALDGVDTADRGEYVYHLRRGWLYYLAGDHRESVAAYEQAVALEPRAVEPRLGLMLPQMALHLWLDAETTAAAILSLDPKNYVASSRRAWVLYNLGRYDDAEVAYRQVLELYPSDVAMRSGLGWCLLQQELTEDAAAQFRIVLQVDPADSSAAAGLAAAGG